MEAKVNAITAKVLVWVVKEEVVHKVMQYKASKKFEDDVSEAVYDAL